MTGVEEALAALSNVQDMAGRYQFMLRTLTTISELAYDERPSQDVMIRIRELAKTAESRGRGD